MFIGAVCGAAHGVKTLHIAKKDPLEKITHLGYQTYNGIIMGPWFPVLLVAYATMKENPYSGTECQIMKSTKQPPIY
jgi:hypothetical protein